MKFSELLGKEGLVAVSEKTNISIKILQTLVDNDFGTLTRVRTLGFLSILKREYEMPFDDLESSIKSYFEEHGDHDDNDDEPLLISVDKTKRDTSFVKWLIIAILLGGLWYLIQSDKLGGTLSSTEKRENKLKDSEVLKNDISEKKAKESVIVKDSENENKTEVEIQTAEATQVTEEKSINKNEVNNSVKVVSNQVIENNKAKVEENSPIEAESSEKAIETDSNETEIIDEAIKPNIESVEKSTVDEEKKAKIIYNVTVNPTVNLWFGFINLDTKERKEFMTTESTPIDVGEQRWILMTGHGRLTVASDSNTLEINDRVKHYFYIDSNEIREINRTEFKTLNNGRGW